MKLGVVVDQIFFKCNNAYSTDAAFIEFLFSFHSYFETIEFISRVLPSGTPSTYHFDPVHNPVVALPFYKNIMHLCLQYPLYSRRISGRVEGFIMRNDIIFVMIPHPIALKALSYCKKHKKKTFIFVRQNLSAAARLRFQGLWQFPARAVTALLDRLTLPYCRMFPVLAMGSEMQKHYAKRTPRAYLFANSKFTAADLIPRDRISDIDWKSTVRLLFVGRLDHEKGVAFLLHALTAIRSFRWTLKIVGTGPLRRDLELLCRNLGIADRVQFAGYITYGPALLDCYRNADMVILPSLGAEGLPQSMLEAMACGAVVLAANNSGMPGVIQHGKNGFLFQPASSKAITEALESVRSNTIPPRTIRENALSSVEGFTRESQHRLFERICSECYGLRLQPHSIPHTV